VNGEFRGVQTVVSTKEILRRAKESEDGEAYAAVARGPGFRIGVGARTAPKPAAVFIEVILDPFPERPRVSAERLAHQAEVVTRLQTRGYVVECDEDSTITCERRMAPARVAGEIRDVQRLIEGKERRRD